MTDLSDLISRVEAGKGADRELDIRIKAAIYGGFAMISPFNGEWCLYREAPDDPRKGRAVERPRNISHDVWRQDSYTTSLDAVLSLMPPECFWQLGHDGDGPDPSKFKARAFNPMKMRGPCVSVTVDPVRALLAAILRAKEAGE